MHSILTTHRDPATLSGYLELHVEQGKRLIESGKDIGIVTGIVGIWSFKVRFRGRADHAGTKAMDERSDAAQGACAFTLAVRELVTKDFPGCVATVGKMIFEPGAFNVVPEIVTVSLEFRSERGETLIAMREKLLNQATVESERYGLSVEIEPVERSTPVDMHPDVMQTISQACDALHLSHIKLPSGAGHDAQIIGQVCPAGMIFVPSIGGFSHSPREFTHWKDCVNGANVLLHAALMLADK